MRDGGKVLFLILFSFFILHSSTCLAQEHIIDSLWNSLKNAHPDSTRANTLNYLSFKTNEAGNYAQSDSLAKQALQLSQELNYKKGIARAFQTIGINYEDKGVFSQAIFYYNQALNIKSLLGDSHGIATSHNDIGLAYEKEGDYLQALENFSIAYKICEDEGDKKECARELDNIGYLYYAQGIYPKALDNELKALEIRESLKDSDGMGTSFEDIGNFYYYTDDYTKALDYYAKALSIMENLGYLPNIADISMNMGLIYQQQKEYVEAQEQFSKALKIDTVIGNRQATAKCYYDMGYNLGDQGKYPEALKYSLSGLSIFKDIGDKGGIASSLQNIGKIYLLQKNYKEGLSYETDALQAAKDIGSLEVMQAASENLSKLYEATGNLGKALSYYKIFSDVHLQLYNIENSKKTGQAELTYEFDRKEAAQKAEQEKKDAVTQERLRRKNTFLFFIIVLAVSIAIIAIIIFRSLKITRGKNILIEHQKTVAEEQKLIVEAKNKEILDSITYAKRLQDAILPPATLIKQYFPQSFVFFKPKDIVSGDFFWMERVQSEGETTLLLAAADCTGHGVPGAMVSVVCSNALNQALKEFHILDPGRILDKVRELVLETFEKSGDSVQDGMDISLLTITYKMNGTREMKWSGANNPLWCIQNGVFREFVADKQPVGLQENSKPFTTQTIVLSPPAEGSETILYLFTDGYADQFGGSKMKKFKYKPLQQLLTTHAASTMESQESILEHALRDWQGNLEQVDDILIIGVKV